MANQINSRDSLYFPDAVKKYFSFIENLGFQCICTESTFVRFESRSIYINVYHGRHSYEINLEVGSKSAKENEIYSISALLHLVDVKHAQNYRNYAAHTVQGVDEGVKRLAIIFKTCVDNGILKDDLIFLRLRRQREKITQTYALEVQLEQARKISESAWMKKDFQKVVQILGPLQAHLSDVDLKKLEYAKKQLTR